MASTLQPRPAQLAGEIFNMPLDAALHVRKAAQAEHRHAHARLGVARCPLGTEHHVHAALPCQRGIEVEETVAINGRTEVPLDPMASGLAHFGEAAVGQLREPLESGGKSLHVACREQGARFVFSNEFRNTRDVGADHRPRGRIGFEQGQRRVFIALGRNDDGARRLNECRRALPWSGAR